MSGIGGGGRAAERESLTASFLNGVLATVLATPCTAPFLGSALGFAFTQSAGLVFVIFAATGLGMALPYAILAARPGWTRFLPKPGAWMERFKQLMGFLLMGTVLWLLWVLGKQLGMEAVIWTLAFLLCLSLSCWIIGQWLDLRSSRRRRVTAWIIAVAITAAGYNIFVHPLLASAENLAQLEPVAQADGERWQPFSVELVEELIASDHHVFVDFTAEWCWTCKVNELTVLAGDDVRERFAELDVQLIRADWTNRNAEIAQLLRAFGRSGVPLYVIFPSGRPDHPLVLPELITSGIVLGKLEEAVVLSRESTGVARSLELRQTAGAK
jgi:thiol:disulfide interchange protein DsbD